MHPLRQDDRLDRRRWVQPGGVEHRVEAAVAAVRRRRDVLRRRRRRAAIAAGGTVVAAAAAAALLWLPGRSDEPSAWAGTRLETGREATRVALADGSQVEAFPHSRLALLDADPREVRIALAQGAARFEVARQRSRRFVVEAGPAEIRVVGTRFVVRRRDSTVSVRVSRGRVEVEHGGRTAVLGAGERWASQPRTRTEARPDGGIAAASRQQQGVEVEREHSGEAEQAEAAQPLDGGSGATDRERRERRGSRRARRAAERPSAAELFEQAAQARRAGRPRQAERHLTTLLARHGNDSRAPLAAFELGRLRMDELSDASGAARALERSLQLSPRSAFRQELLARLVNVYRDLGRRSSCARVREQYLRDHPDGRYAAEVKRRGCRR